jgi:hypothetical protein
MLLFWVEVDCEKILGCYANWMSSRALSGFAYPLSFCYILLNIFVLIRAGLTMTKGHRTRTINRIRKELNLQLPLVLVDPFPYIKPGAPKHHKRIHICPSLRDLDYPDLIVPDSVHQVGPILLPAPQLDTLDAKLAAWLSKRKTVLISLGSQVRASSKFIKEMHKSIHQLLQKNETVQVLWKLQTDDSHLFTPNPRTAQSFPPLSRRDMAGPGYHVDSEQRTRRMLCASRRSKFVSRGLQVSIP